MCEKRVFLWVCVRWRCALSTALTLFCLVCVAFALPPFFFFLFGHLLVTLLLQPQQRRVVAGRPVVFGNLHNGEKKKCGFGGFRSRLAGALGNLPPAAHPPFSLVASVETGLSQDISANRRWLCSRGCRRSFSLS